MGAAEKGTGRYEQREEVIEGSETHSHLWTGLQRSTKCHPPGWRGASGSQGCCEEGAGCSLPENKHTRSRVRSISCFYPDIDVPDAQQAHCT